MKLFSLGFLSALSSCFITSVGGGVGGQVKKSTVFHYFLTFLFTVFYFLHSFFHCF
jgi:hypothetical protein